MAVGLSSGMKFGWANPDSLMTVSLSWEIIASVKCWYVSKIEVFSQNIGWKMAFFNN